MALEFALNKDKRRIHAMDAVKECQYFCPLCGGLVIPRQGEVNAWHFAHHTFCVDDWKYDMSAWHRAWQERFPAETREIVVEVKGESHRADILVGGYTLASSAIL